MTNDLERGQGEGARASRPRCQPSTRANASSASRRGPASHLVKRLTLRGFIVWDFAARQADFLRDMGVWVRDGRVRYREDVVEGLENAPAAFLGLLNRAGEDSASGIQESNPTATVLAV
jgi:hypothetical protein